MTNLFYTIALVAGIDILFFVAEKLIKLNRHIFISFIATIILYLIGLLFSGGIIYLSIDSTKHFNLMDYFLLIFNILYAWFRITDRIQKLNRKYGNL